MFYYIDQLRTPSFPSGLVKTEFDFIVRSVECDLARWTLVVAVISVDVYLFLTCHIWRYRNWCFLVALCRLIVRRPNLEVATKRLLHQQVKTRGIVLVPSHAWKCVPTTIYSGVDISEVPGWQLFRQLWLLVTFQILTYFNSMNYGHIM